MKLEAIYETLLNHYGDLGWWPADTPFEVMVGAILTQNTAWTNVEKAIARFDGDLTPARIQNLSHEELEEIIRPAGFYRQKSDYLKNFTAWFARYGWDTAKAKDIPTENLRKELLAVLYSHIHALIVENAKTHCRKIPRCTACPLERLCAKKIQ